jgi:hypothetical protein
MGETQKQITLNKFSDVAAINAFVATRPSRARLVFKTSRLAGWQLDLIAEKKSWVVGYYIDGFEDRSVEYDVTVKWALDGYVDEKLDGRDPPYVLWLRGGLIFITLPHERSADVTIVAPQVCGRADRLREPVYIWRNYFGFNVLDCTEGFYTFRTKEEFEDWVRSVAREAEAPTISWAYWYVIPGAVSGGEEWPAVVRRAVRGNFTPTPDDVIALVRKLL